MNPTDLAWAAGIVDGEGHIMIRHGKQRGRPNGRFYFGLRVANTDRRMVDRLAELFGGAVLGPRILRLSTRPAYEWQKNGQDAARVLRLILPYLVVKGDQAEVALRFADTLTYHHVGGGRALPVAVSQARDEMVAAIKQLRAAGGIA